MTALPLGLLVLTVLCLYLGWRHAIDHLGERPDDQLGPSERGFWGGR